MSSLSSCKLSRKIFLIFAASLFSSPVLARRFLIVLSRVQKRVLYHPLPTFEESEIASLEPPDTVVPPVAQTLLENPIVLQPQAIATWSDGKRHNLFTYDGAMQKIIRHRLIVSGVTMEAVEEVDVGIGVQVSAITVDAKQNL